MSIIPPINVSPDEDARLLEELLTVSPSGSGPSSSGRIAKTSNGYLFEGIEYAPGRTGHLELHGLFSDKKGKPIAKKHPDWITATKNAKVRLPTSREWYQVLHRLYANRNVPELQETVAECIESLRSDFQQYWLYSGTGVDYSGVQGTITHHGGGGTTRSVAIPEFTPHNEWWTYLELAPEQPTSRLGNVNAIPPAARPALEELLGPGYQDAGAVFQYAGNPLDNGNLRKVWFSTPTAAGRVKWPNRALVLGVVGRFGVYAVDRIYVDRHARGVAVRENFP